MVAGEGGWDGRDRCSQHGSDDDSGSDGGGDETW